MSHVKHPTGQQKWAKDALKKQLGYEVSFVGGRVIVETAEKIIKVSAEKYPYEKKDEETFKAAEKIYNHLKQKGKIK